ncbi:MAG TPA: methylmalonyl Co-A mutase-associated GTPase MeaB [Chloroflexota bacterium]|jgi:LAO/AO transport system kinase|nr:methylmalonyl Co-A mutase-associated GTPase MeaB [Chloroflexota bacterium]
MGRALSASADAAEELAQAVRDGSMRAAGRAISLIEDDDSRAEDLIRRLYPHTGSAYAVGFTGPPGAGKSTLVDDIVHIARGEDKRVGVIAVDPNSPFTGGAILGDRIRMMRHTVDAGVFIRSMGSRGHLGGLALASAGAVFVLDALGMDYVFLETVGVGQSELAVAEQADTVVVVLMPGLGDGVQTIKAGIMEIADIYVVNKADHPAVERTFADLKELLRLDSRHRDWVPPIVKTVATAEEGARDLWQAVAKHRSYLTASGELDRQRRHRLERQVVEIASRRLRDQVLEPSARGDAFQALLQQVSSRQVDPFAAADSLVRVAPRAPAENDDRLG